MGAVIDVVICFWSHSSFRPPNNNFTVTQTALYVPTINNISTCICQTDLFFLKFAGVLTTCGQEECSCGRLFCSQQTCWPSACWLRFPGCIDVQEIENSDNLIVLLAEWIPAERYNSVRYQKLCVCYRTDACRIVLESQYSSTRGEFKASSSVVKTDLAGV